ncbi:hypothetical protein PENSTE_c009G08760 [Penicillium steckii]|uniref:Uncharacterized protein n=1 Tax=Penicillium steckii TaxID=303698 RepID=A0A1V6TAC2_9EURO|nr:hypothetical protein PENSTE_c009G08760 [Penicillium steckii]
MDELPKFLPNVQFEIKHAPALAEQLKLDQTRCKESLTPSRLVLVLPKRKNYASLLDAIAWHITPYKDVPPALRWARCEAIIESITAYWNGLDSHRHGHVSWAIPQNHELDATLKVLRYLESRSCVSDITQGSSFNDVVNAVKSHQAMNSVMRNEFHEEAEARLEQRVGMAPAKPRCYMCCRMRSSVGTHDLYSSLCIDCGDFNLSSSNQSLPPNLYLWDKNALVTGGRINLGYHTALRLLRCGAHVIVSSRYPADAASRYSQESDFKKWEARLKIIGADFRTAKDAFRLVHIVKETLRSWGSDLPYNKTEHTLDILINNAAQTLTDPVRAEARAISREEKLRDNPYTQALIAGQPGDGYRPMIRGGMHASWIPSIENDIKDLKIENGSNKPENKTISKGLHTDNTEDSGKSSWVQSINEIPYEDLISAHSVNAFVPLILCRELLPYMGSPPANQIPWFKDRAQGYIVNVSSREGISEDVSDSRSKAGYHVHTNMSKAAINMITETEAGAAWESRRVAMNTVDPGYMSAAPDCQPQGGCPIGFEDGAARVLWPIVVGQKWRPVKGKFLKHFQEGSSIIR